MCLLQNLIPRRFRPTLPPRPTADPVPVRQTSVRNSPQEATPNSSSPLLPNQPVQHLRASTCLWPARLRGEGRRLHRGVAIPPGDVTGRGGRPLTACVTTVWPTRISPRSGWFAPLRHGSDDNPDRGT